MVDFGAVIGDSADWTKKVLFKPFNFKKWLILAFIAIMAGSMSNGCNFNDGRHYEESRQEQQEQKQGECVPSDGSASGSARTEAPVDAATAWAIFGSVMLFIVALLLIFMWLGSRFSFVFIDDIVRNDASIRKPFSDNAVAGNSYFRFNIVFMLVFLLGIASFVGLGILIYVQAAFIAFIPLILVFTVAVAAVAVFMAMLTDLALPIMYKDR
ncbi:MAG: hypothetical protein WC404_00290, partial [Candidatus Omnitrophota bacterium]